MSKQRFLEFRSVDIGTADVNMKATAATDYSTGVLDLRGVVSLTAGVVVDNTGTGSVGLGGVYLQRYDAAGVALGAEHALCTAIDLKADTVATVSVSEYLAAEATNATIGATDRHLLPFGRCTVLFRVEEASDATTCTASMWLVASQ